MRHRNYQSAVRVSCSRCAGDHTLDLDHAYIDGADLDLHYPCPIYHDRGTKQLSATTRRMLVEYGVHIHVDIPDTAAALFD